MYVCIIAGSNARCGLDDARIGWPRCSIDILSWSRNAFLIDAGKGARADYQCARYGCKVACAYFGRCEGERYKFTKVGTNEHPRQYAMSVMTMNQATWSSNTTMGCSAIATLLGLYFKVVLSKCSSRTSMHPDGKLGSICIDPSSPSCPCSLVARPLCPRINVLSLREGASIASAKHP
jgi:hypothetical protein